MRLPLLALAIVGAGYAAVRRQVGAIQANPDPIDPLLLESDPPGDTVWLDRPDGARMRSKVAGSGPDVVLLHGYGVSMRAWTVVATMLVDAGFRVICADWRGHGQTTIGTDGIELEVIADDIVALLEEHDVTDGVLVGHSTGGYVSIATLLEHPETADRLRGLVLFASLAGDAAVDAPQTRAQIPLITSGLLERMLQYESIALPFAASIYGPNPSPAACRAFIDDFLSQDHQALVPLLSRLAHTSFYDRLGEIEVSTVVVCGEEDQTTPRWHSERMGELIPNARNVWVPGHGHALNWSKPEVLVELVHELHEPSVDVPAGSS
ncbi:alpha/beta fold hydrolase [Euzebya tangerina]|uniref:alpha/beta fold hydrolase n=1 Tax=Euzebya tangerina TaxID=591198 RepID=UPI000E31906A|nr:alpha/beta hydrolase [Euzebya tangerina]